MLKLSPSVTLYPVGAPSPSEREGSLTLPYYPDDPAFGDGSHPTTRLCAGAVDLLCRQLKPRSFLDVGTGTGVLARIARARGAKRVVATDIAPEALRSAKEHSALDEVQTPIDIGSSSPDSYGKFDLVVANILEGTLRDLSTQLVRALAPEGRLLLSGFTRLQIPSLLATFTSAGLELETQSHLDEWVLLVFRAGPFANSSALM